MQRQGAIWEADNAPLGEFILLVPGSWASQPPELREINFYSLQQHKWPKTVTHKDSLNEFTE